MTILINEEVLAKLGLTAGEIAEEADYPTGSQYEWDSQISVPGYESCTVHGLMGYASGHTKMLQDAWKEVWDSFEIDNEMSNDIMCLMYENREEAAMEGCITDDGEYIRDNLIRVLEGLELTDELSEETKAEYADSDDNELADSIRENLSEGYNPGAYIKDFLISKYQEWEKEQPAEITESHFSLLAQDNDDYVFHFVNDQITFETRNDWDEAQIKESVKDKDMSWETCLSYLKKVADEGEVELEDTDGWYSYKENKDHYTDAFEYVMSLVQEVADQEYEYHY